MMARVTHTFLISMIGGLVTLVLPALEAAAIDYSSNAGATVGRVRVGEHPGFSRIVLDTTKKVKFKYETSPDGRTIAVELPNIKWSTKESHVLNHSKNIDRIEFVPSRSGSGTVLIEGKTAAGLKWVRTLSPHSKRGNRLVLDVASRASATLPAAGTFENNVVRDAATGKVASAPPAALPKSRKKASVAANSKNDEMQKHQEDLGTRKAQDRDAMANSGPKPYVAMKAGLVFASAGGLDLEDAAAPHTTDTSSVLVGGSFGAAVGVNWAGAGLPLRSEFEFTYRFKTTNSIDATNQATGVVQSGDLEIKSHNYMLNTYYDIDMGDSIAPYVGFGLGLSRNSVEVDTVLAGVPKNFTSDESTNLAWSLNAGASYFMTPDWALDFGYRYISLG
jgi:opacity protein-like surface antigen